MHVLFCHETYYSRKRDGTVYSYGAFPYSLWEERFLPFFESVTVVGRKKKLRADETGVLDISSGKNVDHILLPDIHRPIKRLTKTTRMYKKIKEQVERADAVVIRGPVDFGMMAAKAARECGKPYAIEMCGCAYDRAFFQPDVVGKAYAPLKYKRAQEMVLHADAVMYVTQKFLQERYPTNGLSEAASNVEIAAVPEYVLQDRLKRISASNDKIIFGLVGNFENGLKGMAVALDALGHVIKQYKGDSKKPMPDFEFKILGQAVPAQWQDLIEENGLQGKVKFCGRIPSGQAVMDWLDGIDIFIKPSFHEGLPRPVIEAMSRGCVVLSSNTGGVRELLSEDYVHDRGNAKQLADQIITLLPSDIRRKVAEENFVYARNYSHDILAGRRQVFWQGFAKIAQDKKDEKAA